MLIPKNGAGPYDEMLDADAVVVVVEVDEVDSSFHPVVVGLELVVGGIVGQALLLHDGLVEPIGKLRYIFLAVLRRDGFVVADTEKYRKTAKRP